MIGIIGAMPMEVDGLKERMTSRMTKTAAGVDFYSGVLSGVPCVVARCNPGKVNAALCAQIMISDYRPQAVINSGVAGGIGSEVHIGDLVVASAVVQHDMDTTPVGDKKGYLSGLGLIEIPAATRLTEPIVRAARDVYAGRVHLGVVATGDQFICSAQKLHELERDFHAVACEMEGGAVGHVCRANGVDFAVLRAVSDNADDDAAAAYSSFAPVAAQKGIELLCEVLPKLV